MVRIVLINTKSIQISVPSGWRLNQIARARRSLVTKQSDTAHALRVEWVQRDLKHLLDGGHTEAEKSLRKCMIR
jgi:hypothetical protein